MINREIVSQDLCNRMNTENATPVELATQSLRNNAHLARRDIVCEFLAGALVLRGRVPTYYLKQIAQHAVGHLDGVERIDNQIEVV